MGHTLAIDMNPSKSHAEAVLPHSFFRRRTEIVASDLLGKKLVRQTDGVRASFMITEVEAYIGPHDLACHSSKGRTPRTEVMYMDAGTVYVYLIYGMYHMLNIVTEEKGFPAAVLIRSVEGISGPGRVAKALRLDKSFNGVSLSKKNGLWIEDDGTVIPRRNVLRTARIGVSYAGKKWANKKLRFVLKR